MNVYIVFLDPNGRRYIDSAWPFTAMADQRISELKESFAAAGVTEQYRAWRVAVKLQNCKIADGAKKK